MIRRALAAALAAALTWGLTSAPAVAGSTTIGAASEIAAGQAPDPFTVNRVALQGGTSTAHTYVVPAGGAIITQLMHRTGSGSGSLTFKVYRPTSSGGSSYRVIASETHTVTAGTTASFNVRIPVRPGDVLGLTSTSGVQLAYDGSPADKVLSGPGSDPGVGATASFGTSQPGFLLDVAAVVETDADGDGFGDQSQDQCSTDASTQGPCVNTSLTKKPKHKVYTHSHKAKVKLKFTATVAGSTFQCSVDGSAFTACTSPFKAKYKVGKHTVQVRAVKPNGAVDPDPATVKFKVKKRR